MVELEDIQKHCMTNLSNRQHDGKGTVELYDNDERRRIALHNFKANKTHYLALGNKFKKFRQRVELLVLTMQEPCRFLMEKKETREEWYVNNAEEMERALREGYELSSEVFKSALFRNPCGEIRLGRFELSSPWRTDGSYEIGGSPYSKHLSQAQLRMVGRAVWRRLNLASLDSVIVEALPYIKISKSVMTKLTTQVITQSARELVYTFYNQSRQPQWWSELRSYRGGLRDKTNLQMYAFIVADYIYDAIGIGGHMPASWKTEPVMGILKTMRESEDFSIMPILADALGDAGCGDEALLFHYRNPKATYSLGSWIFRASGLI